MKSYCNYKGTLLSGKVLLFIVQCVLLFLEWYTCRQCDVNISKVKISNVKISKVKVSKVKISKVKIGKENISK